MTCGRIIVESPSDLTIFKLHLFDVELTTTSPGGEITTKKVGESSRIRPGLSIASPVDMGAIGKVGLEVCYDIRCAFSTSSLAG